MERIRLDGKRGMMTPELFIGLLYSRIGNSCMGFNVQKEVIDENTFKIADDVKIDIIMKDLAKRLENK